MKIHIAWMAAALVLGSSAMGQPNFPGAPANRTASPGSTTNPPVNFRNVTPGLTNAPTGVGLPAPGAVAVPTVVAPGATPQTAVPAPGVAGALSPAAGSTDAVTRTNEPANVTFKFVNMPFQAVLDQYSDLVKRTPLRGPTLPQATITLVTQSPLTRTEAISALETILGMNQIAVVPIGDKFYKVVIDNIAGQAGGAFSDADSASLPEMGRFITKVVQLKYAQLTEVQQAIANFAKGLPNSIVGVPSTQTLILRDYTENVNRMLELIQKIDVVPQNEFKTEVIPIKYALANDIQSVLGSLTPNGAGISIGRQARANPNTGRAGYTPGQPGAIPGGVNQFGQQQGLNGGFNQATPQAANQSAFQQRLGQIIQRAGQAGDFQILGQAKIIADERTNSLLVFANEQDMAMITNIISKIDVLLAQVLIESIIMEVSIDNGKNIGVSYLQNPQTFGKLTTAGGVNNGAQLLSTFTNLAGQLPSGFSYFGSFGRDFDFAVTAAATDSRINVLSRPHIQTSHAVQATLFVGDTVPYVTGTLTDINGGSRSQYQQTPIGITLTVTPLINPDGLVVMDIDQNIQQLGTPQVIDGNPVPTTTERRASAKVAVRDRDTIALGGFITTTKSKTRSGVPYLMDIPVLGNLFRSRNDQTKRVELIVLIRPTVLPTPESAALAAANQRENLPGVRLGEMEIRAEDRKRQEKVEEEIRKMQKEKP